MKLDLLKELNEAETQEVVEREIVRILSEVVEIKDQGIDELTRMLDAARRGLGLANRLTGPSKKKHMSMVLTNLNKIRAGLHRAIQRMDDEQAEYEKEFSPSRYEEIPHGY